MHQQFSNFYWNYKLSNENHKQPHGYSIADIWTYYPTVLGLWPDLARRLNITDSAHTREYARFINARLAHIYNPLAGNRAKGCRRRRWREKNGYIPIQRQQGERRLSLEPSRAALLQSILRTRSTILSLSYFYYCLPFARTTWKSRLTDLQIRRPHRTKGGQRWGKKKKKIIKRRKKREKILGNFFPLRRRHERHVLFTSGCYFFSSSTAQKPCLISASLIVCQTRWIAACGSRFKGQSYKFVSIILHILYYMRR